MDVIEKFLHSIAYKFPKGYMDMNHPGDVTLLESELGKLGINLNELKITDHWSERVKERGNILDIENLPKDYPLTKEEVIQLIENELIDRTTRLENLKDLPSSISNQIGYKLLQPVINHDGKNIILNLKVRYSTESGYRTSLGNSYLVIIDNNSLITFILLNNDDSVTIEKSMADHLERKNKKPKPIKIFNPTNYKFIIPLSKTTEIDSITKDELPYKVRTDYRVGANFEHEKYGIGKIVATSSGSGGKGDSRGYIDWVDVDFGKTYVSGGVAKTIRRIPNIYTLISTLIQKENINEAKQIGDIYHFTDLETLYNMMNVHQKIELDKSYSSLASNSYYSFTRNPNLLTLGDSKHQVRIELNGDKMSNKYKFEPYVDVDSGEDDFNYSKNSPNFVAEERISSKYGNIDLTPYIENITIIDEEHFLKYLEHKWSNTKYYNEMKNDYYSVIEWIKSLNIPLNFSNSHTSTTHRVHSKHSNKI